MILRHSPTSPYTRKVMVLLHETGLIDQVRIASIDGWREPDDLTAENPLSMVPTLVRDDGVALFDSPVICEYLDTRHDGAPLLPREGDARWTALRRQAQADGILDCAVLTFMETVKRPEALRWDWWAELKRKAIRRALDAFEAECDSFDDAPDMGLIAIACALSYLDLRGAIGEWRDGHPQLTSWYERFAARPSMVNTTPPA